MSTPLVKLGDVCEHNVQRIRSLPQSEKTIAYIDIGAIANKRVQRFTEVARSEAPGRAQWVVQRNDVLLATVRPNLNNVALVEALAPNYPTIASTGFCVLRATKRVLPSYIYHWLQTSGCVRILTETAESRASYPSVTDSEVFALAFPLPPLAEQERIVVHLERTLGAIDAMEAKFREGVAQCGVYRRAVLSEAFGVGGGGDE